MENPVYIFATKSDFSNAIEEAFDRAFKKSCISLNYKKETSELLSIEDASKYLNLAKQTLYGFTSRGIIPYLKKGKKLYFKRSELDKWINEGKKN
jgi:excisionase family DNA binding protein